ncbi:hypothetical protein VitviT2T_024927 [Vitis vinifera]|uniref:Uncharacterized protein n=1 Tax=Vitis vinifera TaxID=29760 RepID=A0ABY9DH89_VITVI|nr:hypothetical protein VitviT2T_024927 [Vitis vinifera]
MEDGEVNSSVEDGEGNGNIAPAPLLLEKEEEKVEDGEVDSSVFSKKKQRKLKVGNGNIAPALPLLEEEEEKVEDEEVDSSVEDGEVDSSVEDGEMDSSVFGKKKQRELKVARIRKKIGIERKVGEKMKDDEELERLLGEIPHATSNNHHHQHQQDDTSGNHHHCVHGLNGGHGHGSFVSPQLRKLMWLTFTRLPQ